MTQAISNIVVFLPRLEALLLGCFLLPGCSVYGMQNDPGLAEAFSAAPLTGHTETFDRVRGFAQPAAPPAIAQPGEVWPAPPVPVTGPLLMAQTSTVQAAYPARLSDAEHHRGGFGLCRGGQASRGAALGVC